MFDEQCPTSHTRTSCIATNPDLALAALANLSPPMAVVNSGYTDWTTWHSSLLLPYFYMRTRPIGAGLGLAFTGPVGDVTAQSEGGE